jgi:hypothetical protein
MERPVVSDLTDALYDSLGDWLTAEDEANDWVLLKMVAIWVEVNLDPVYELARGRGGEPPWSRAFDPDECPAFVLPYLAQFVGVDVVPEQTEQQLRNEIKHPTGWKRGQTESMRIATRRTLTGENPLVIIHSRFPGPGHTYVRTLLSQTPDPARTAAVLRAATPAWNLIDYEAIEGVTFTDVAASTNWETLADLAAAFPTFQALTEILPTEI